MYTSDGHVASFLIKRESIRAPQRELELATSSVRAAASPLCIGQAADLATARIGAGSGNLTVGALKNRAWEGDTGGPTKRTKKASVINALQRAIIQSSTRILGPSNVIEVEVFGGRAWKPLTSAGGVAIERAQLRPRVLIDARPS